MTVVMVRPFEAADAQGCAAIFDSAWNFGHPYAPRAIDVGVFLAETEGETLLVAEAGHGLLTGFASLLAPQRFIHHLYVEPRLMRLGIGRALLDAALALVGGTASLKCQTRNAGSAAFYRSLGWRPAETGDSIFGPWVRMLSPAPNG